MAQITKDVNPGTHLFLTHGTFGGGPFGAYGGSREETEDLARWLENDLCAMCKAAAAW